MEWKLNVDVKALKSDFRLNKNLNDSLQFASRTLPLQKAFHFVSIKTNYITTSFENCYNYHQDELNILGSQP